LESGLYIIEKEITEWEKKNNNLATRGHTPVLVISGVRVLRKSPEKGGKF